MNYFVYSGIHILGVIIIIIVFFSSLHLTVVLNMEFGAGVGRGRGAFMCTPMTSVGRVRFQSVPITSTPMPDLGTMPDKDDTFVAPPPLSSVRRDSDSTNEGNASAQLIVGIAKVIGISIGESIASCIESKLGSGASASVAGNTFRSGGTDPSLVNLVVKSEIKEPVCFKGDGSDAYTVHEWESVVMSYLRKQVIPVAEQADEVMNRLMGRAREVVRVGIRSNPFLVLSEGPGPIFDILKQHFSDTVSSIMPLADFYATLPFSGEDPFEYWLRLNKAMEVTEDCLKRQNKTMDDSSRELTTMFIRHCPDSELSLIFRCKPLQQWTAAEVHEKLVEHRRDKRHSYQPKSTTAVTMLRQDVSSGLRPSLPTGKPISDADTGPALNQTSQEPAEPLDRILSMLERILEQGSQRAQNYGRPERRSQGGPNNRARSSLPCEVCGDRGHTTRFHCRANHLCFLCYASGHIHTDCPKSVMPQPAGGVATKPATQ